MVQIGDTEIDNKYLLYGGVGIGVLVLLTKQMGGGGGGSAPAETFAYLRPAEGLNWGDVVDAPGIRGELGNVGTVPVPGATGPIGQVGAPGEDFDKERYRRMLQRLRGASGRGTDRGNGGGGTGNGGGTGDSGGGRRENDHGPIVGPKPDRNPRPGRDDNPRDGEPEERDPRRRHQEERRLSNSDRSHGNPTDPYQNPTRGRDNEREERDRRKRERDVDEDTDVRLDGPRERRRRLEGLNRFGTTDRNKIRTQDGNVVRRGDLTDSNRIGISADGGRAFASAAGTDGNRDGSAFRNNAGNNGFGRKDRFAGRGGDATIEPNRNPSPGGTVGGVMPLSLPPAGTVTVQKGETLRSLSKRVAGHDRYLPRLVTLNNTYLMKNQVLKAGTVLRIG